MAAVIEQLASARSAMPEPLPLTGETVPVAAFPVDALGPVLSRATKAIMKKAYVPAQTAVQSVLSAASLALQPHFNVVLPTGQYRPISLFLVTIADSGDRKSTSDDYATNEIVEYQKELDQEHQAQNTSVTARRAAWDISKAEVIRKHKAQGPEMLTQALEELGEKPTEPYKPVIIARVGTTQGLLKFFEVARPSLGLMSDEGGSWLGGYGMTEDNKLATVATLSDLWDGKPIQRMTSGEGMMVLYGRRLTFHLMIQPILAGRLLGDAEMKGQGFLSRLLVTQPETLAGTRIIDPSEPEDATIAGDMQRYRQRLSQVIRAALPHEPDTSALNPKSVHLSVQARLMWWAFYNDLESRIGPGGELADVRGFVGKLPEQAARLAVVVAAFDEGVGLREIGAVQMARGIALAEYYLSEAVRLFGIAPVDPTIADAAILSDWLRDKWTENLISIRVISQKGPNVLRKSGADRLRMIVEALVRHNHLGPRLPNGGPVDGKHCGEAWRIMLPRSHRG